LLGCGGYMIGVRQSYGPAGVAPQRHRSRPYMPE
jgi:hypothetical protein